MGVYDTFSAPCPKCKETIEVQTKDFDSCMNDFTPGTYIEGMGTGLMEDEPHPYCSCKSKEMLYMVFRRNIFLGFTRDPNTQIPELPAEKEIALPILKTYKQKIDNGEDEVSAFLSAVDSFNEKFEENARKDFNDLSED